MRNWVWASLFVFLPSATTRAKPRVPRIMRPLGAVVTVGGAGEPGGDSKALSARVGSMANLAAPKTMRTGIRKISIRANRFRMGPLGIVPSGNHLSHGAKNLNHGVTESTEKCRIGSIH